MKPIQNELKEIRLEQGITLEKIHEITKINLTLLESIETGDFSVVPRPFLRAFLKEYGEVLGIDPDRVIMRFENRIDSLSDNPCAVPPAEGVEPDEPSQEPEVIMVWSESESRNEEPEPEIKSEPEPESEAEQETEPTGDSTDKESPEPDTPPEPAKPECPPLPKDDGAQASLFDQPKDDGTGNAPLPENLEPLPDEGIISITRGNETTYPKERKRLDIKEPEETNAGYIAVFVIVIIIAAIIIFFINKG